MIAGRLDFSSLEHRLILPFQPSSLRCSSVARRPAPRSSSYRCCSSARQLLANENGNVWTGVWTGDRKAECETCDGKGAIPCSVGVGVRGSMAGVRNDEATGVWHLTHRATLAWKVPTSMQLPARSARCYRGGAHPLAYPHPDAGVDHVKLRPHPDAGMQWEWPPAKRRLQQEDHAEHAEDTG